MSKPQLFCFTYAGGNASFYDQIEKDLPDIEFIKTEYAGHGKRHREAFFRSFDELADDVFGQVKARYSGGDYGLFGYSMGTITLVEVLKRIFDDPDLAEPSHVFLSAHEPHTKAELSGFSDEELDEWVKQRTIRFGAVPEKLINNNSFWRLYLPLYRADYSLIGKYRFEDLNLRTAIPATIFYSQTDTPRVDMELWKRYFVGDCRFYEFPGTHFFIQDHHDEMGRIISSRMKCGETRYDV